MARSPLNKASLARIFFFASTMALGACADQGAADSPLGEGEQPLASSPVGALTGTSCSTSATVDPARSLMVTDQAVLDRFPLAAVLNQILTKASVVGPTALELYQRWWDSQNTAAGGVFPDAIHCDDEKDAYGNPTINGFPIQCPRNEGKLATSDPFDPASGDFMKPVAIVNRFDVAPVDGGNCGEYRIIYAKKSGETSVTDRNLVIFEAVLPNPNPSCGLAACRPVAEFWAGLSAISDPAARADALEAFYFTGLPGFSPVITPTNYGMAGPGGGRSGQIRTNQFMSGSSLQIWQLREFQLDRTCGAVCKLAFKPVTVKNNPFGALFNGLSTDPRAGSFQSSFIAQVPSLAPQDANAIGMNTSDAFNAGQSNSQLTENDYAVSFTTGLPVVVPFAQAVQSKLASIGRNDLLALNIAERATTQSCGGCHQVSSGKLLGGTQNGPLFQWPAHTSPLTFVHVSETSQLSKPLTDVFLPHRKQVLEQFLATAPCSSCASAARGEPSAVSGPAQKSGERVRTLGGSVTH